MLKKVLGLFFFIGLFQQVAIAADSASATKMRGLTLSADESSRDLEADSLELTGHVQIIFRDQHLSCDKARINFRAKTVDAIGNVLIVGPKSTVNGSRVYLDYESNTGVIYEGSVQAGNAYFEGSIVTKTGDSDYIADNARFTTCTNCPESWSFSGQKIRAELGGYAYIKNSFLKFGGVPVFWLPYLIVPLKSDRQTGLLTPEIESSASGGLTLSESFFWAISKSQDATITLKNYELRGLKSQVTYRYMLSQNSYGELDTAILRDRVFAFEPRLNGFRSSSEQNEIISRWFTKYEHYFELPDGFIQRMQLSNASDLQYPKDFPIETKNHGDPAMENRISLTKNTSNSHFSMDSSYYVNLLQSNPLAGNNDAVHRMPEIRYSKSMAPLGDSGLLYTADLNYANYTRSDFGYDDMNMAPATNADRHVEAIGSSPECSTGNWYNDPACRRNRDGVYDPSKDIIRTGQRMDGRLTLYRPILIGSFLDILPKLTYRETQYRFAVGDELFNARRYMRAEVSTRSLFSRIYGSTRPGSFERMKHEIEPEVTFTTIPYFYHPSHPFFGSQQETPFFSQGSLSNDDLNSPYGIQFDYNDRVYDRKLVTFGVTNKLIQKSWLEGSPSYRQVLTWKLAQSYDLYQEELNQDRKQPLSDVLSDLKVYLDKLQIYQRINYYPYQQVTNSSSRLRLLNANQDFIEIAHLSSYNITPGQEADASSRTEDYTVSVRKNMRVLEFLGRLTYDINPPAGKEHQRLKSYGYGAQIKLPGDCWYFTLQQYQITGGDTNFRLNFDFIWDGQSKPSLPESLLDSFGF